MYKQIGNKVAYYRKLRNLTQDQLADRVSISVSSISKLERGKYNNTSQSHYLNTKSLSIV